MYFFLTHISLFLSSTVYFQFTSITYFNESLIQVPNNLLHLYYNIYQLQCKLALKQILWITDLTGRIIFTISLLRTQVWADSLQISQKQKSIPQNLLTHEEEQQTAQKSSQRSDGSRGLSPLSLQERDPFAGTWLGISPGHPPSNKQTVLNHTCIHKMQGDSVGYCN